MNLSSAYKGVLIGRRPLNQIITVTMIHLEDTITFSALLLGGKRSNYNENIPSPTRGGGTP